MLISSLEPLRNGWLKPDTCKDIVHGDEESKLNLKPSQIYCIHNQYKYILHIVAGILKSYHNSTLQEICKSICTSIFEYECQPYFFPSNTITEIIMSLSCVQKWFRNFIKANYMLTITLTISYHPKNAPSIFLDNPELCNGFHNFAEDYHSTLNVESAREYLITVWISCYC
jgi:hypothetical protein